MTMHISSTPIPDLADYLAQDVSTRADEADIQGKLPLEDVQALQNSGYLTISVPRQYGGQGASLLDCVAAQLKLAEGSGSTAIVAGMPIHIFGHARETSRWEEETYAGFCQEVVKNNAIFNSVASEPQLGSPSRGGLPQSTAAQHPEGWVVNGHKIWTTGGRHLTHMLVRVHIDDDPAVVLVKQDMPGISWEETWLDSMSLRASDSHDVFFDNVIVPPENLVERGKNPGPPAPSVWFPMIMASVYLGCAFAARNAIIKFALERVPTALGKPISTLPKIQRQIGEIDIALQGARALMFEAASLWNGDNKTRDKIFPRMVAAKYLAIETANDITDKALRVAGGQGISKTLPLERYFRDVRAGHMQPPSGDTALEIAGRYAINA